MLPVLVFSGLLAIMLVAVLVHQRRDIRPQGRHVAGPTVRDVRRERRMPKHAA
jgi:hypothetical protein